MSTYSFDQAMDIMQTKSEANSSTYNVDLNFMLQLPSSFLLNLTKCDLQLP